MSRLLYHSSGWIESVYDKKKLIPILYLPWWHAFDECIGCSKSLTFTSDCQQWCSSCNIICIGCRYCLTTNIIFGLSEQSLCMKCKRTLPNDIDFGDRMNEIGEFLCDVKVNPDDIHHLIVNYIENIEKEISPLDVYKDVKVEYMNSI